MNFLPIPYHIEGDARDYSNHWHTLPDEIIHHILGIAAASSADTCRSLCLVSKWVLKLVQHHLPSVVLLRNLRAKQDFTEVLQRQNQSYLLSHESPVHSLWIGAGTGDVTEVLAMLPNVINFAMNADYFRFYFVIGAFDLYSLSADDIPAETASRRVLSANEDLTVTVLDRLQWTSFIPDSPHSLLGNIKRLRFLEPPPHDLPFSAFSTLTHIALPVRFDIPYNRYVLNRLLGGLPTLRVLVTPACQTSEEEIEMLLAREDDTRIYCVEYGSRHDDNWEREARGDRDWWKRANEYTAALQRRFPTS